MHDPERDGVDHLNVYSKAKTELGRWMTNWARQPITTEDGDFESMEGYWYWLGTHDERFRTLVGWGAKTLGKELPKTVHMSQDEFRAKIKAGILAKAAARPDMVEKLKATTIPLAHYYVFNGKMVNAGYTWINEIWDEVRTT